MNASCKMPPSQMKRLCHHEAGHAVMTVLVKRPFRYATIISDEATYGHVSFSTCNCKSLRPETVLDGRTRQVFEKVTMTVLAGFVAEGLFAERRPPQGAAGDFAQLAQWLSFIRPPGELLDAYLLYLTVLLTSNIEEVFTNLSGGDGVKLLQCYVL